MDLEEYVDFFSSLHQKTIQGVKAPHKPILLLAIIHLIEKDVITENCIRIDNTLKSIFKQIWDKIAPRTMGLYEPNVVLPMWRMHKELFWHHRAKDEYRRSLRTLQKEVLEIEEYDYNRYVDYAELDSELFFLLSLDFARDRLKEVLLSTYLNKTLEGYKLFEQSLATDTIAENTEQTKDEHDISAIDESEDDGMDGESFAQIPYDIQLLFSIAYYSFLKDNKSERKLFLNLFPSVSVFFKKVNENLVFATEITDSFKDLYVFFLKELSRKIEQEEDSELYTYAINKVVKYLSAVERFAPTIIQKKEEERQEESKSILSIEIEEERKRSSKEIEIAVQPETIVQKSNQESFSPSCYLLSEEEYLQNCTIFNSSNHIRIATAENLIVYNSTGYAIKSNNKLYRINKTYNSISINSIILSEDKTFSTGERILFARDKSPLFKALSGDYSYEDLEIIIDLDGLYSIFYKDFSYSSNGDVVAYHPRKKNFDNSSEIDMKREEPEIEQEKDDFEPKGNLVDIPLYVKDSYDYLWIISVLDIHSKDPLANTISISDIGLMMISNAHDLFNVHSDLIWKDSGLIKCVQYATNALRANGYLKYDSIAKDQFFTFLKNLQDDRITNAVQVLTQDAQFNILKAWFPKLDHQNIYMRALHFSKSCLYGVHLRNNDSYIEINPNWRVYLKKSYNDLRQFFVNKYLEIGCKEES